VVASARRPRPGFANAPSGDWGQARAPEKDFSRPPSLFERVTQSFARQRQEHVEAQPEPAMAGGDPPERPASKEEELYDIPTFLRR
jgi:hypothetical protein